MFKGIFEFKRHAKERTEQKRTFYVATGYNSVSEDVVTNIVNRAAASFKGVMSLDQADFSKFESNQETMHYLDKLKRMANGETAAPLDKKTWEEIARKARTNTSLREALSYIANMQETSKSFIDAAYKENIDRENTDIATACVRGMDSDMYTKLKQLGLPQERKDLVFEKVREMANDYRDEDKKQIIDRAEAFLEDIPETP